MRFRRIVKRKIILKVLRRIALLFFQPGVNVINLPPVKSETKRLCKCDGCGEVRYTLTTEPNVEMEVNKMRLCDSCRQEFIDWLRYWS